MVICPVCHQKVYVKKGKVVLHGSNESLCYGSYMSAKHCYYVEPQTFFKSLIHRLFKLFE